MNIERFGKLYDMLMSLPNTAPFDMNTWGMPLDLRHECATPACAIGWYARLFPEDGLHLHQGGLIGHISGPAGFAAIAACFDIHYDEAEYLFGAQRDSKSAREVAWRVEAFIKART